MLDSIQKHGELLFRHPGALAVTALGTAALTADIFFGTRESHTRRSTPEFYIAQRKRALGVLVAMPGCQTDGKNYHRMIRKRAPEATVVGVDYPKHGSLNEEQIYEGLADSLIQAGAERPSFVCQSMSGIAVRQFMRYADQTGVAERLGGFGTIVLDSSPFDRSDVRGRYRALLAVATATHYNWSLDHMKLKVCKSRRLSGADAHLDTIHNEGKYMKVADGHEPMPAIMDRVVYINSLYDPVINSDQAAAKYEAVAPKGTFTRIVDKTRKSPSHTATGDHLDTLIELATSGEIAAVEASTDLEEVVYLAEAS